MVQNRHYSGAIQSTAGSPKPRRFPTTTAVMWWASRRRVGWRRRVVWTDGMGARFWCFLGNWVWRGCLWSAGPPRRRLWRRPPPCWRCRAKLWRLCGGPLSRPPIFPTAFVGLLCIFFAFRRFLLIRLKWWIAVLVEAFVQRRRWRSLALENIA